MRISISRTPIETWGRCQRQRFWADEFSDGLPEDREIHRGLERDRLILPLETGSHVHEIARRTRKGTDFEQVLLEELEAYRGALQGTELDVEPSADKVFTTAQEIDLVEALARTWQGVVLPQLEAEFESVSVEEEMPATFVGGFGINECTEVELQTRPDEVLRRRFDGAVFILNYKTAKKCDRRWREKWLYDTQTFSECLGVEARLGLKTQGTIIIGLVKGSSTEYPKGSGRWQYNNPLIWTWFKDDEVGGADYRARFEWLCEEPHGKCPGGKSHRLSGYRKVRVAESYPGGIKAWIERLLLEDRELVEEQVVRLEPILRSDYEIERWKRQTLGREVEIRRQADAINAEPEWTWREDGLDRHFPMTTGNGNCLYCPFREGICFGMHGADPLASGLFRWKQRNHPAVEES